MQTARVVAYGAAVLSAVMGLFSLGWGCIFFAIIALAAIGRYAYLKVRSKNEPYLTEIAGVIVTVDPKKDYTDCGDPYYYLE